MDAVRESLAKAFDAGRPAQGYVIVGPVRREGRALAEWIGARLLGDSPAIADHANPDMPWFEPEKVSRIIDVGMMRERILPLAQQSALAGGWKVIVIVSADRMKAEAEQNAENDKKERERIDKLNQADSMIFTTENFLKDNGDKIPADQKPAIENALQTLKDAHKNGDVAAIDSAINNLNQVMQAASAQMYQGAGAQGAQPGADQGFNGGQQQAGGQQNSADEVQDADFEEVK